MRSRLVPPRCKKVLFKAYYIPILTYASKTCTMERRGKSKVQALEIRFLWSCVEVIEWIGTITRVDRK